MQRLLSELLHWSTLWIGLLWFVAGAFLAWNRGLAAAVYFPALVSGLPAVVALSAEGTGESFGFRILPMGSDPFVYVQTVFVPLALAILGGHVAAAINPNRKWTRQAALVEAGARKRLYDLERDLAEMIHAGDKADAPAPGEQAPATDALLARAFVTAKQNELRSIRRVLSPRDAA